MKAKKKPYRWWVLIGVAALGVLVAGRWAWQRRHGSALPDGIVTGNGRLEATEVDVASKSAGRVAAVLVSEGDRVDAGQVLARMDTESLKAQLAEAQAQVVNAKSAKVTALAVVTERRNALAVAQASVVQRESDVTLMQETFGRTHALFQNGSIPKQQLDVDQSKLTSAKALFAAQKAQVDQARASIDVAKSQVDAAEASIAAVTATTERIKTELADAELKAPRGGRVQHRLVESGEVVGAGGKIVVLVDLTDVYMTVFLPETAAGKLAVGGEARLVLDSGSQYVIPAKVSYVASEAQFTPKTVETKTEREKLSFEVKLQLDPVGLAKYEPVVKVGLPGVAYVRVDPTVDWPGDLTVRLPPAPPPVAPSAPSAKQP